MSKTLPNVLSIAGSDPSGGAGILADLRTFAAFGVYGTAALAALTAQNTTGVSAVMPVPADFLRAQLDAVFSDVRVDAVKIGMLGTSEAVRAVAVALREYRPPHVVLDPVLRASTGAALLDADALDVLRDELLPRATLITPNAAEAGALLGVAAPRSVAEAHEAAAALVARGAPAALVTGGHLGTTEDCVDVLHDGRKTWELSVPRTSIGGGGRHGTGCTFSSAVAALLALGRTLPDACAGGQRFVAASIIRSVELQVGRGVTPVNQLSGEPAQH